MPFSFPSSPSIGDQSTQNGFTYSWTGSVWQRVATPGAINAANISDSTTTGRALITTASASAARTTISAAAADLVFNPFLLAGM